MLCFYEAEIDFAEIIDEFALFCHLISILFNLHEKFSETKKGTALYILNLMY